MSDDTLSRNVSQRDDDAPGNGGSISTSDASVFIEHKNLGRITLGRTNEAHDQSTGADLSGTGLYASTAVGDWNGEFFLRSRGSRAFLRDGEGWGAVLLDDVGDGASTKNGMRYTSREVRGFVLELGWSVDTTYGIGLKYDQEIGDFEMSGAMGLAFYSDRDDSPCDLLEAQAECVTFASSSSILHKPTGLNFTYAGGQIHDKLRQLTLAKLDKQDYWHYAKLGLFRKFFVLGKTALYAEYYHSDRGVDIAIEPINSGLATDATAFDADATVWGMGTVQHFENAPLETFITFRQYKVSLDALPIGARQTRNIRMEDFHVVLVGARLEF